jgi:hypothetical protein
MDRNLIADVVERTMRREPTLGTWSALERASNVSHATMHRVKTASPKVSVGTFQRIEGALDLPSDTLVTVGAHDIEGLRELGAPDDLIQWVTSKVSKESDYGANSAKAL